MSPSFYVAAYAEAILALALLASLIVMLALGVRDAIRSARRKRALAAFYASPEYLAACDACRIAWGTVNVGRNAAGYARSRDMDGYRAARRVRERMERAALRSLEA